MAEKRVIPPPKCWECGKELSAYPYVGAGNWLCVDEDCMAELTFGYHPDGTRVGRDEPPENYQY